MDASSKTSTPSAATADFLITTSSKVVIGVHRAGPAAPMIAAVRKSVEGLLKTQSDSVGLLLVLQEGSRPPEGAGRDQGRALFNDFAGRLQVVSVAMEGSGFWAAATRSVLTFMLMAVGDGTKHKVHASLADATAWLARELPGADARQLTAAVDKLRKG